MKRETITTIIFAILGAFLIGFGVDISFRSFTGVGFTMIIIAICLAISNASDD